MGVAWWDMDYSKKFTTKLVIVITVGLLVNTAMIYGLWLASNELFSSDSTLQIAIWASLSFAVMILTGFLLTKIVFKPLKTLSDSIVFAGHKSGGTLPQTENLFLGSELITGLSSQVYDLASMSTSSEKAASVSESIAAPAQAQQPNAAAANQPSAMQAITPDALDHVGIPIFGIDSNQNVTAANKTALEYIDKTAEETIGKPFYDVTNLSFDTDETFETWLKNAQENAVTEIRRWERVRIINAEGNAVKQFDLTANYSKRPGEGTETLITFFDRTNQYSRDDQEISFVALAVHELRTPLTILKGYIEVFEDEIGPTLSPELLGFMHKMQASAEQLTSFVGNILNVARVEENQLTLTLQKSNWAEILKAAISDLELRAQVYGKHIDLNIADNIPDVGVDRISIHEVINNLVDNAIKYSGDSDKIVVTTTVNDDGLIETSIQDFGIGIPDSVVSDLFQKFYRSHRSKGKVSGTGLGLYLSKALISAHGGNIWVRTKEGQGSIFSFTILPFDQVESEEDGQDGIMRGAHGWIKNHTMNRQ